MIKPAIVAVGYNRPQSMKRLLKSICAADYPFNDITLVVSIDECSKSDEVEDVAREIIWGHGEKIIRRYSKRQGLREHILQCGDLSLQYGAVIILEDDLLVSQSYYLYTYSAINYYSDYKELAGIALYSHAWNGYANLQFIPERNSYDAYLGQYCITWGQCWTKDRWMDFREWYKNHDEKLPRYNRKMPDSISRWSEHSWGKYYVSYLVEKDLFYVVPYTSMTTNFSEVGQHSKRKSTVYQVPLMTGVKKQFKFPDPKDAVKYDVFFERILDGITVAGIPGSDICVNLNCSKTESFGRSYMLTTQKLKGKLIASYGMFLHPIDSNITHSIEGNDIYLYGGVKNKEIRTIGQPKSRVLYEMYGHSWKTMLKSGYIRLIDAVRMRIR